jgi:hypothetical protein
MRKALVVGGPALAVIVSTVILASGGGKANAALFWLAVLALLVNGGALLAYLFRILAGQRRPNAGSA